MKFKVFIVFVFFVCYLLPGISLAQQNKVVVIPLTETVETPLEPFAQVTAESPPNSDYTDNGDGTVTDHVTGLVWQRVDDNTTRSWDAAMDYCKNNTPSLPGTSWRLPSIGELISIVYYGTYSPAINGTIFPGTNSDFYWSATPIGSSLGTVWMVYFNNGEFWSDGRAGLHYVRCVRGVPNRQRLFKNNGNGTVTDLATGLTWQREDDNVPKSRDNSGVDEAILSCLELNLAGGGWRLPTIKELLSIADDRVFDPAFDSDVFPGANLADYWSATTYVPLNNRAWIVFFRSGSLGALITSSSAYVRCVR